MRRSLTALVVLLVITACAPEIDKVGRPDVVLADFDPDAERLPFPFDALAEDNPFDVVEQGFAALCDLSRCPADPDKRTGPLAEERCRCVDFQEWDDEDLSNASRRAADADLAFEWRIKQRLHRLDGFPVTRPLAASFSHRVDLTSLDRNLKGARSWDGEQNNAAKDVPGHIPSLSPLISRLDEVTYDDPEAPGQQTSRWLVSLEHPEPLLQRKTYLYVIKEGVHGQELTQVPAYTVTQRFLPNGQPNPDCDQPLSETTCSVPNSQCEQPGATPETCMVYWPVVADAATWFALSDLPLCEYGQEHSDEELLELLEHHQLPECLESTTEALELEDVEDLEQLRINLNDALNDEAVQASLQVDRERTKLIWAATTQSIAMPLQKARADLYRGVVDVPAEIRQFTTITPPAGTPRVAAAYRGRLVVPDLRDPDGLLLDVNDGPVPEHEVTFELALPVEDAECTPPFRVALVGHGLGGSRADLWGVADALGAECLAGMAFDLPGHGEHPITELWSDDPFLITGVLQQAAVEMMQAVRALDDTDGPSVLEQALAAAGASAELLDGDEPGLIAGSLGGLVGVTVMAVEPDIRIGTLSAIGGDWSAMLPGIDAAGYLPAGILDALQAWQLTLGPHTIDVTSWVMERMDPAAYSRQFRIQRKHEIFELVGRSKVPMTDQKLLIQAPRADAVLPLGATAALAISFGSDDTDTRVTLFSPEGGHRALFDDGAGHALSAAQAARFLKSRGVEVIEQVKR